MTMTYCIENRDSLLSAIAHALVRLKSVKVDLIEVTFFEDEVKLLSTDLTTALQYLGDDIYWNEEGNWSQANRVKVTVM